MEKNYIYNEPNNRLIKEIKKKNKTDRPTHTKYKTRIKIIPQSRQTPN